MNKFEELTNEENAKIESLFEDIKKIIIQTPKDKLYNFLYVQSINGNNSNNYVLFLGNSIEIVLYKGLLKDNMARHLIKKTEILIDSLLYNEHF